MSSFKVLIITELWGTTMAAKPVSAIPVLAEYNSPEMAEEAIKGVEASDYSDENKFLVVRCIRLYTKRYTAKD